MKDVEVMKEDIVGGVLGVYESEKWIGVVMLWVWVCVKSGVWKEWCVKMGGFELVVEVGEGLIFDVEEVVMSGVCWDE